MSATESPSAASPSTRLLLWCSTCALILRKHVPDRSRWAETQERKPGRLDGTTASCQFMIIESKNHQGLQNPRGFAAACFCQHLWDPTPLVWQTMQLRVTVVARLAHTQDPGFGSNPPQGDLGPLVILLVSMDHDELGEPGAPRQYWQLGHP